MSEMEDDSPVTIVADASDAWVNPFIKYALELDKHMVTIDYQRRASLSELSPYRTFRFIARRYYFVTDKGEMELIAKSKYDKWVESVEEVNDPFSKLRKRCVVMDLRLNLNRYLMEDLWRRYDYTFNDIIRTVKKFRASQLWLMLVAMDMRVLPSSSKRALWDDESNEIKGKSAVDKKIELRLAQTLSGLSKTDKLMCDADKHRPPVRTERISEDECKTLLALFPSGLSNTYATTYKRFGAEYVPFQYYNGFLEMTRVEPQETHYASEGKPSCMRVTTPRFNIAGKQYCSVRECFLIATDSMSHLRMCPNAPADAKVAWMKTPLMMKLSTHTEAVLGGETIVKPKRGRKRKAEASVPKQKQPIKVKKQPKKPSAAALAAAAAAQAAAVAAEIGDSSSSDSSSDEESDDEETEEPSFSSDSGSDSESDSEAEEEEMEEEEDDEQPAPKRAKTKASKPVKSTKSKSKVKVE